MINNIYILDENKKLSCILSNTSEEIVFYDYEYHSYLSTGADTFDFTVKINSYTKDKINSKNFVLFFRKNKARIFQIMSCDEDENILTTCKKVKSETVALELRNSHIRPCTIEGNINKFLTIVLQDTNYKIGYIDPELDNLAATTIIDEITPVYTVLQNAISTYNNIELEFDVEVVDSINGKYNFLINVYADGQRGNKTYKRIEHNFNSYGITRSEDSTEFCSGIIPIGVNGLTIKDVNWEIERGDPLDKPQNQDFLLDPEAHEMFSNGDKYILRTFDFDDDNAIDLCWSAYRKLQEIKNIKFDYNVPVYLTDEEYDNIEIGDTVYVINDKFETPIQLEARISELILTDSENECKLSNYKEVASNIKNWTKNDAIKDIENILKEDEGKLTSSQIGQIQDYIKELEIQNSELDKLIQKAEDKAEDTVTEKIEIAEDSENYRAIKLAKIDNGLWLGDQRIYDLKRYKVPVITSKITTETTTTTKSSSTSTEYKNAVDYYGKFSLGTKANNSCMSKLKSKSNTYKIYAIVEYWAKKFGLDKELIYAMIYAESSGNPYCSGAAYGLMQCEKSAYYGHKTTLKFLDGSTKTFTPSSSTMTPGKGGKITLNGIKVDKNISNQVMFGCHELRVSLKRFKWNIFAALMGYNFGLYGADLVICRYVAMRDGLSWVNKYGYTCQSSKVQAAYFKELEKLKADWANGRTWYVSTKHAGTAKNIEYYLRWYKVVDGQLPYVLDDNGKKKGYGAVKSTNATKTTTNTTIKTGVATSVRNKIVSKAKEIVDLHVKYKKATYNQVPRTYDDSKRVVWKGIHYGIKNPVVYDCSSFVSCCYKAAGLTSVYNAGCKAGTLVSGATKKSGYMMWKVDADGIKNALPGDIVMDANFKVTSSNLNKSTMTKWAATHHTMIYIGDSKVAHASKWNYHPNAIKISNISYYQNKGTAFFLRPYDLVAKDNAATLTKTTTTTQTTKIIETNEIDSKGIPGATPKDFFNDSNLIEDITINTITDDDKYPKTVSHCFLHFGINDLTEDGIKAYQDLIKILLKKYPKKPIFIAKEPYVNSQYTNQEAVNNSITTFNNAMKDFANRTRYVIQVGVPAAILDSNKQYINTSLTENGYRMKDKLSTQAYYAAYKKAILVLATGGNVSSSSTKSTLTLHTENIYKYTKPMQSIEWKLPTKPDDSYYARLVFTTQKNKEPTKYKQPNSVYLQGTHCKKGQLIPKADTTYTIVVYYNPDTEISDKRYLGSVSAVSKGGKYATFDKFKYADTLSKNAITFFSNRDNFVYNNTTPADFKNPAENIGKWRNGNGTMNIDDSAFLNYVLMGWDYFGTPYHRRARTDNKKNSRYNWALNSIRHEANIAKYFVEKGWVLDGADLDNFTNLQAGDIIFMDADSVNNGLFMGCSHTAIVTGKNSDGVMEALECTSTYSKVFQFISVSSLQKKNILFIGRIRID